MKLTEKDDEFLRRLKVFIDKNDLDIEFKSDGFKRLVLRRNYGSKIESAFGLSRQGIRWRFKRVFNEIYVNAYLTIYLIESQFGIDLRQKAIDIAKEQVELRIKANQQKQFGVVSFGKHKN